MWSNPLCRRATTRTDIKTKNKQKLIKNIALRNENMILWYVLRLQVDASELDICLDHHNQIILQRWIMVLYFIVHLNDLASICFNMLKGL